MSFLTWKGDKTMNNKSIFKDLIEKSKVEPKPTITAEEFRERLEKFIAEAKKRAQELKETSETSEHAE